MVLDLDAQVEDGDGDTADTSFQVIFDADCNLVGSDDVDDAMSGIGASSIDGKSGEDTVSYEGDTTGVTVDLSTSTEITNVENLTGGSGADTLIGDANDNIILGGDGNDQLFGGAGNDNITGGADDDIFVQFEYDNNEVVDFVDGLDSLVDSPDDIT